MHVNKFEGWMGFSVMQVFIELFWSNDILFVVSWITSRLSFTSNDLSNYVDFDMMVIYFQTTSNYCDDNLFSNDFGLLWWLFIFKNLFVLIWCDDNLFSNDYKWWYVVFKQVWSMNWCNDCLFLKNFEL